MKRIAPVAVGVAMAGAIAFGPLQAQTVATADYGYSPVSPGSWTYLAVPGGSEASFVDATGAARMIIACGKLTRLVTLSRITAAPASRLSIWTSSGTRNLPSRFDQASGRVIAQVGAADTLLDAIALSRGRIAVSMPGSPAFVLPVGTEVDHVVEDCRT